MPKSKKQTTLKKPHIHTEVFKKPTQTRELCLMIGMEEKKRDIPAPNLWQ